MNAAIAGPDGKTFAVRTIFAIGRNYAEHATELGNAVPDRPMFFLKAASSVVGNGASVPLPEGATSLHHEVELVALIGAPVSRASAAQAKAAIAAYAVGVDWTDRDLQAKLKAKGHPWAAAKSFRGASCLSEFIAAERVGDPQQLQLRLSVDGEVRQDGSTADMINGVYDLVAFLSTNHDLQPGDLVFTGTPAGVSAVGPGQRVEIELVGLLGASFMLTP